MCPNLTQGLGSHWFDEGRKRGLLRSAPVEKTFPREVRGTADPSTALRSGRDDKGLGGASSERRVSGLEEQQVPPLRFAPVGMTLLLGRKKN
jgi:hypothetical protein